jgi:hypothetical protein
LGFPATTGPAATRPRLTGNSPAGKPWQKCHWPDYPFGGSLMLLPEVYSAEEIAGTDQLAEQSDTA